MQYTLWFVDACSCVAKKPLVSIFQVCSGAEHVMNSNMTSLLQITLWQHIRLASQFAVCARKNKKKLKASKMSKNVSVKKFTRDIFNKRINVQWQSLTHQTCKHKYLVSKVGYCQNCFSNRFAPACRMSRQSECRLVLAQNLSGLGVVCQVRCADSLVKELRWCKPPICPRWDSIYLSELTGGRIF